MHRLIVTLSTALLIAMAASADARGRGGPGAKGFSGANGGVERQAQFQQELNLSDEQILQMRKIRQNGGSREEIHSVLNDEQRAMVNERRSEMKDRAGRGGNGQGRGNGQGFGNSRADAADANGG